MMTKLRSNTINAVGDTLRKDGKKKKILHPKTLLQSRSCDVDYFIIAASTQREYQTKSLNLVLNSCF